MPLEVYTARLGYRGPLPWLDMSLQGNLRRAEQGKDGGQDGIGLWFAPPPDLLYPYLSKRKWGRLTADDWPRYADDYTAILRGRWRDPVTRRAFDALLSRDVVVLLCFCAGAERCEGARCAVPDCSHCHRRVLAEILVKLGAGYRGELEVPAKAKPIPAPGEMVIGASAGRCSPAVVNVGAPGAPELVGAILCGGRTRAKPCTACGARSSKLCDFPLSGKKAGKTCDAPICDRCATAVDVEVDYCPPHAKLAREGGERRPASQATQGLLDLAGTLGRGEG